VSDYSELCLTVLNITPVMNILPSQTEFEGDVVEVICKVVAIPLKNIEVFLMKDERILKKAASALSHQFTAQEGGSGELVCKAQWGSVQKQNSKEFTVKGKTSY